MLEHAANGGNGLRVNIEPPAATSESYSGFPAPAYCDPERVLGLALEPQSLGNWCWAAIASSIGRYYGTGDWSQADVARALLGGPGTDTERNPTASWDEYARLDAALGAVGCFSHWSPGRPTFERVQVEIQAGRPVCVHIDWRAPGSHYVVITGYFGRTREIYVDDSRHGRSIQPYDRFPSDYHARGGVWIGTFWTTGPERTKPMPARTHPRPEELLV